MSEHTKGRLYIDWCGSDTSYDLDTEDGSTLVGGINIEDARRLAACWNACEGLTTEQVETVNVNVLLVQHHNAQRELAAARALLREVVGMSFNELPIQLADLIRSYLDACDTLEGAPNAG